MDAAAAGAACFVGVNTGPNPGAAGFRGVVGCDREAVDATLDGPGTEGVVDTCDRPSFPGEASTEGAIGDALTGVVVDD